jgi:hypothetical protein
MMPDDLFVGAVSAILGSLGIATGVGNWDACYELAKLQWLVGRLGRTGARLVCIAVGLLFVAIGVAISLGVRVTPAG